jgi:hypothetical protein
VHPLSSTPAKEQQVISRFLRPICFIALLIFPYPAAFGESLDLAPQPIDQEWVAKWRKDLAFAKEKMPEVHIRIDHTTPRVELEAAIDDLARRIPALAHHEAVVELARIVVMIGDGHTRLTIPVDPGSGFSGGHRKTQSSTLPGTPFRHYPVRFYLYADGLAVEQISPEHADLLGARVVRIGGMTAEEAMEVMEPTVQRDNSMQIRQILPYHLVIPELLHARGVTDILGPLFLELRTLGGERRELTLKPVDLEKQITWAESAAKTVPLYRRNLDRNYSFEYLKAERTVYFRYVTVQNDAGESLAAFSRRMFAFIEANPVERFVIDLRGNGGGNNWLNAPLELGVIRAKKLWRPGGLVALADRNTFSAAMNFVSFLAGNTPAIFVGEAAGGRPNHYGDAKQLLLPNTGLTIRLSTVYHQDSSAQDDREQIDPHLPVSMNASDVRTGRDPVLETVLGWNRPGEATGVWQGVSTVRRYRLDISLRLQQEKNHWSGRFSASGLVEETAIESAEMVEGEIRFEVPLETSALSFRARAFGDRLIGMFEYNGQWYPFVAERSQTDPS